MVTPTFKRFRIGVGLGYDFGFRFYNDYHESNLTEYKQIVGLYLPGEYFKTNTQYTIKLHFDGNVNIPLFLELKPIKAVEMKLSYMPNFNFTLTQHEEQYIEDDLQAGSDAASFTDPIISEIRRNLVINHDIGLRFRFVFPKVVRLIIGATFNIEHSMVYTETKQDSDTRTMADGSEVQSPITGQPNHTKNYPTHQIISNNIAPFIGLDFEILDGFAVISIGWSPRFIFDGAPNTETDVVATNILNLANWTASCVMKFDPNNL